MTLPWSARSRWRELPRTSWEEWIAPHHTIQMFHRLIGLSSAGEPPRPGRGGRTSLDHLVSEARFIASSEC